MERLFLSAISGVLKFFRIKYSIDALRVIYYAFVNVFQISIMIVFASALGVLSDFGILIFTYFIFRNLGKHDHFETLATCFVWSNFLFLPHIFVLHLIDEQSGTTIIYAVGLGIVSGIALSKDYLISSLFAYEFSRSEVLDFRNKTRLILKQRIQDKEIIDRLIAMDKSTQSDLLKFALLKYGEGLTTENAAKRINKELKTGNKLDEKIVTAFADLNNS